VSVIIFEKKGKNGKNEQIRRLGKEIGIVSILAT